MILCAVCGQIQSALQFMQVCNFRLVFHPLLNQSMCFTLAWSLSGCFIDGITWVVWKGFCTKKFQFRDLCIIAQLRPTLPFFCLAFVHWYFGWCCEELYWLEAHTRRKWGALSPQAPGLRTGHKFLRPFVSFSPESCIFKSRAVIRIGQKALTCFTFLISGLRFLDENPVPDIFSAIDLSVFSWRFLLKCFMWILWVGSTPNPGSAFVLWAYGKVVAKSIQQQPACVRRTRFANLLRWDGMFLSSLAASSVSKLLIVRCRHCITPEFPSRARCRFPGFWKRPCQGQMIIGDWERDWSWKRFSLSGPEP